MRAPDGSAITAGPDSGYEYYTNQSGQPVTLTDMRGNPVPVRVETDGLGNPLPTQPGAGDVGIQTFPAPAPQPESFTFGVIPYSSWLLQTSDHDYHVRQEAQANLRELGADWNKIPGDARQYLQDRAADAGAVAQRLMKSKNPLLNYAGQKLDAYSAAAYVGAALIPDTTVGVAIGVAGGEVFEAAAEIPAVSKVLNTDLIPGSVRSFFSSDAEAVVELTRFDGHLIFSQTGVRDAQEQTAVPGGVSPTNDRVGSRRPYTGRVGARV